MKYRNVIQYTSSSTQTPRCMKGVEEQLFSHTGTEQSA